MKRTVLILLSFIVFSSATISADPPCGDVNDDENVNILDIVHLINFKYKSGEPPFCGTVTDYDGRIYQTVKIGDQTWMTENLKTTHYRNGDPIPYVTDGPTWLFLTSGAYCNYNNNTGYVGVYSHLYNWYAVDDSRNIAPEGWHVASDDDWKELEMYLGMSQGDADSYGARGTDEGGKLKDYLTGLWDPPNTGATNATGFTGLPAGARVSTTYMLLANAGLFWTSTAAGGADSWYRMLNYDNAEVYRGSEPRHDGLSIRCVKD